MHITDEQLRNPKEVKRILLNIKRYSKHESIKRLAEANKINREEEFWEDDLYSKKLKEAKLKYIFREKIVLLIIDYWNEHEGFYGVNLVLNKFNGNGLFSCCCGSGGWSGHQFDFYYKDIIRGKMKGCTTCESKYSDGAREAEHKDKLEKINKASHKITLLRYIQEDVNCLYHCGNCDRHFYKRPMSLKRCELCFSDAKQVQLDKRHNDYITYISINRPDLTLKRGQLVYKYNEKFNHYCLGCGAVVSFTANSVLNGNGKCQKCREKVKKHKFEGAKPQPLKRLKPVIYNLKPALKANPINFLTVKYVVSLNSPGYVYAIRHEWLPGRVKVGATTLTPESRARSIQNGGTLPIPFGIITSEKVNSALIAERIVHNELAVYHIGGEWFSCSDEDIKRAFLLLN